MRVGPIALLGSAIYARTLIISSLKDDLPESAQVLEALANSDAYEQLTQYGRPRHQHEQTPIENLFDNAHSAKTSKCGARPACPAYEGETRAVNGRDYHLYCYNAPWGTYFWLPKSQSLAECEKRCHDNSYDCNGLTFYPSTGACSIIYSKDARPYIWDNGYMKIGAIPVKSKVAWGPGELCPLPGSDNQVWDFNEGGDKQQRFKISCRNQFKVAPTKKRQLGTVHDVDECADRCASEKSCDGFHYYQPTFPGGRADGSRNCELVSGGIGEEDWVPLYRPNQYLSGLKVENSDCGDQGWNRDEGGEKEGSSVPPMELDL